MDSANGLAAINLGRLAPVPVRSVWPDEARHFTPWLADNLDALGEALGMELQLEAVERAVGPFRADILARDLRGGDEDLVLIENQFGITDHDHAGKLLTYAAGLRPRTVIWIAETFRDEHRAAIEHLNEITREEYRFFAVTVQAMRIGDHPPVAPHFTVVARPNDWSRQVVGRKAEAAADLSDGERRILDYWTRCLEVLASRFPNLRRPTPRRRTDQRIEGVRSTDPSVTIYGNLGKQKLRLEVYLDESLAKAAYDHLHAHRASIDNAFGSELSWERCDNIRASKIAAVLPGVSIYDPADWPRQHEWLVEAYSRLRPANAPYVDSLDVERLVAASQTE